MRVTEAKLEKQIEGPIEKPRTKYRRVIIGTAGSLLTLLALYFAGVMYFQNHFYYGTEINGTDVSFKSVHKVNEQLAAELKAYSLNLKERGNKSEEIKAEEIGLHYNSGGDFNALKDMQNPYRWITAFFNTEDYKITEELKYDDKLLKEQVDKLSCFDNSSIIEPKNAGFKNTDNGFIAIAEVIGNKVDKDILLRKISEAMLKKKASIDLEAENCYINPQYTLNSQKFIEAKTLLDKYTSSKVTYTIGSNKEILDGHTISKWITVDEDCKVALDEGKVKDYINELSDKYNTVGKKRRFVTSSGNTINVGRGDYGWRINKGKEIQALTEAIKEGQTVEKEPEYSQTALVYGSSDIGDTYVEIDLTKQHLWFYKNGKLITEGDVVTGNASKNNLTPAGVYKLKYKQKNAVLRGEDYETPVTYWMPFNGNIGLHDAYWRKKFGGEIYKTKGSHGCVNAPPSVAQAVFDNIKPGTPVVCYEL